MKEKLWKTIFAGSFITLTGILLLMLMDSVTRFAGVRIPIPEPLNSIAPGIMLLTLIVSTIASRVSFNQLLKTNDIDFKMPLKNFKANDSYLFAFKFIKNLQTKYSRH